jgi:sec-independent protein translocase protein TatC
MAGQFTTHILASLIAGLVLGFPYLVWELWRFIKPGLSSKEIKNTRGLVFFVSILFAIGITFGYYIISPLSVNFFLTYQISDSVTSIPTLSTYISTVITVVLASGFIFELPVAVYFLTKAGIVSPELLKKYRRHFFVAALILAAIITPPDVFSQLLVCLPLVILYEISIFLSGRILKAES